MTKVIIFFLLLIGLAAIFNKVANWFQQTKSINIIPCALIEMVAVVIFIFNYGGHDTENIICLCIAITIVAIITILNFVNYGLTDGLLSSIVELLFSITAGLLFVCLLLARNQKYNKKENTWHKD